MVGGLRYDFSQVGSVGQFIKPPVNGENNPDLVDTTSHFFSCSWKKSTGRGVQTSNFGVDMSSWSKKEKR